MHKLTLTVAIVGSIALTGCNRAADDGSNTVATDNMAMADDMNSTANGAAMSNASLTADEQAFVMKGIQGDNAEVQVGQLAQAQGGSAAVKDFAAMLVADHGGHKGKLASLATNAGLTATDEPSADGVAVMNKLKGLSGGAFDKAFKQAMIEDHQKNIAEYEKQTSASNADLAALARETLPVLKKHLSAAKAL